MSAALAVAAATAFNLVCVGTTYSGGTQRTAFSLDLRVDLETQRYCMDDCRQTLPIRSVTPTEIFFENGPTSSSVIVRRVNRESGAYFSEVKTDLVMIKFHSTSYGRCEPAPFTGFPTRKF